MSSPGSAASATPGATTLAVVGAGVVGLCTALQAQRQGYQVTLIDRDRPGLSGASFGNAGYLATELIDPLSTAKTLRAAPRMWLDPNGPLALPLGYLHRILPWLARFMLAARPQNAARSRQALLQLNRAALPAWQRCLDDIGAREQLLPSGYLLVWESADKLADAQDHAEYLKQWGIRTELVRGQRLAELEPELAPQLSHALYFPDAQQVREPYQLCRQLFAAFQQRGGCFVEQPVEAIRPGERRVTVQTSAQSLEFNQAIICAGAWSRKLLKGVGIEVPLEAERGYHLTVESGPARLNRPIGSAERRFVISPLASGLRVVGMTELGGLKLKPFRRRFAALRHHSRALLPSLKGSSATVSEWMGHRPTLPDSLPVIDRHPKHPRLLFAFGNQHLGLTQAAISAELVVSLLANTEPPIEPAPFRVDRF
ncbi:NAD(P)/FAD-dependent oxidoreductase [Marinobacterium arenosum]|uniref:NAD(P)/FAD-dependent oxidoreductase n=1 Tax=Marinobacterium arenosum TaxID=2862496 RepID=UPI001C965C81|nr:FAD-dependent oxidoreductase [Marinobacterium arenosum]MBY4675885.1 FAD-binding oxidoreductase [Marinobacterium arenosum]